MFAEINVEGFWKAKAAEGNALNTLARHSPNFFWNGGGGSE